MRIYTIAGLVLPADDVEASRAWYAETLGLPPSEEVDGALEVNDVPVSFGPRPAVRFIAADLTDGPATLTDPAGTTVELVGPDLARAEEGERHIRDFIDGAGELAGPPVDDLVAATAAVVRRARDELTRLMDGVAHNKVLATQLALGQQARETAAAQPDWALHAASTLLSGLVIAGVSHDEGS